jgi:uncharacterized protein
MEAITIRLDDTLSSQLAETSIGGCNKSAFIRDAIREKIEAEEIYRDGAFPSAPQRTIIYLLLEILKNTKNQKFVTPKDLKNLQTAVFEGYTIDYSRLNPVRKDVSPPEIAHEVRDILSLHRVLANTYEDFRTSVDFPRDNIRFKGFDGNEETAHYSYADFVLSEMEEFKESADVDGGCENFHWPVLEKYRAMLFEWKRSQNQYKLTKAEFIRIAEAKNRIR